MVAQHEIAEIKLPTALQSFFNAKMPKVWSSGEQTILNAKLLGVISARQIDPDLALKSSRVLKQLASLKDIAFVSGWHSPLEAEALRILMAHSAPIVFCVPKSLTQFVLPGEFNQQIIQRRLLLLSHCGPKARRISRDASLRRNRLIIGLATAVVVLSAPEGSASLKLAKLALRLGKPVLTPEHRLNKELLGYNALPATSVNIRTALG